MIRAAVVRNGSPLENHVAGGSADTAINDPADTCRVALTAAIKTIRDTRQANGAGINNVPRQVATPLPLGLKPRKRGYICPQTAATAVMAVNHRHGAVSTRIAPMIGRRPLKISHSRTTTAHHVPAARRTLVAPILPLPIWRMSVLKIQRTMIKPKGMDPSR